MNLDVKYQKFFTLGSKDMHVPQAGFTKTSQSSMSSLLGQSFWFQKARTFNVACEIPIC
jgi:hypothetical protein